VQLTFLGTGGGLPSPQRGVSAIAVQMGSDVLLFDCGEGTQRQFMFSSVSFMKITSIFISHFHGDHFLGLPGLIQSMNFSGRKEPLRLYGPTGLGDIVRSSITLGYFHPGFDIIAMDLKGGATVDLGDYSVTAVDGEHTVPELAYVLEEKPRCGRFLVDKAKALGIPEGRLFGQLQTGRPVEIDGHIITPDMVLGSPRPGRKLVISGDTRPTAALVDAARLADVLVHDATLDSSLAEGAAKYGHSTSRQAAEVALRAEVGELYLTHISNRYDDPSILLEEAKAIFPNSYLAEDLMSVGIKHRD
jgi:ribonuclease Z